MQLIAGKADLFSNSVAEAFGVLRLIEWRYVRDFLPGTVLLSLAVATVILTSLLVLACQLGSLSRRSANSPTGRRTTLASFIVCIVGLGICGTYTALRAFEIGKLTLHEVALRSLGERIQHAGLDEAREFASAAEPRWPWRNMKYRLRAVIERVSRVSDARTSLLADVSHLTRDEHDKFASVACVYAAALTETGANDGSARCRYDTPVMANETASRRSEFYLASLMPADRWRVEMLPCLSDASGISEAAFQMDSDLEGRTGPRLNIGLFSAHPHPPAELKRQECLAKARETTSKVETNWGHLSESITPSPNSEVVSLARLLTKKAPENEGGGPVVEDNETVQSVKLPAVQEKSDGVSPVVSAPQTGPTVPNGAETSVKAEASSSVTGYYCHVMSLARPATQRFWQERFSDVDISSAQSKTRVIKVLVRGKRWYRIGLGPYETQIEAQAVCEQIPARISPDPVTTSQAEFLSSQ